MEGKDTSLVLAILISSLSILRYCVVSSSNLSHFDQVLSLFLSSSVLSFLLNSLFPLLLLECRLCVQRETTGTETEGHQRSQSQEDALGAMNKNLTTMADRIGTSDGRRQTLSERRDIEAVRVEGQ